MVLCKTFNRIILDNIKNNHKLCKINTCNEFLWNAESRIFIPGNRECYIINFAMINNNIISINYKHSY